MKIVTVMLGTLVIAMSLTCAAAAAEKGNAPEPKWKGSIKVTGEHSPAELSKMAKLTKTDATKVALKTIGESDENLVQEVELEVEEGFLIYSVSVKIKGKSGEDELLIDAGNGKVLAREHEEDSDEEGEGQDEEEPAEGDDHP